MIRKYLRFVSYCLALGLIASIILGLSACGSKKQTTPTLTSIAVTPNQPSTVAVGSTMYFYATGTYSDGTTSNMTTNVTWASSDNNIATIDWMALARGLAAGTVDITASLDGITSPAVSLTVTGSVPTTTSP